MGTALLNRRQGIPGRGRGSPRKHALSKHPPGPSETVHRDYRGQYFRAIEGGVGHFCLVDPLGKRGLNSIRSGGESFPALRDRQYPLWRIAPSVETGPSTSGAGRAKSVFHAIVMNLVRQALQR